MGKKSKLMLSSGSPRRKRLFSRIAKNFEICRSPEPKISNSIGAGRATLFLAKFKATHAALRNPGKIVVGADTIAVLDGVSIGKLKTKIEARGVISKMSGRKVCAYTSICVVAPARGKNGGKIQRIAWTENACVKFRKLGRSEIEKYANSRKWEGKAGGFNIDEMPAKSWVQKIKGDRNVIVGLPCARLKKELAKVMQE